MSMVTVATIKPLAQHFTEVTDAIRQLVAEVHAEKGVELFALLGGDDELVIIEKWVDHDAWEAHAAGAPSARVHEALAGKLVEEPSHQHLTAIPAGDARLGQL